jgi:hypothetical protein
MKRTFILAALVLLFQAATGQLPRAEEPSDSAVPEARILSDAELDILLGPIALYPDPLLAALLPAATHPIEIVMAQRFFEKGGDLSQVDSQPWTDEVKALARYAEVLKWMDENLDWTTQVGNSFLIQPEDVMDTIQRLRALAESLGNLKSTPEQIVEVSDGDIDIIPADPDTIYVPVYQPIAVYTQPAPIGGVSRTSFSPRQPVGAWLNHDWDWPRRSIVVWSKDHFRPRNWWSQPRVTRFATVTNVRPWRPQAEPGQTVCKWWTAPHHHQSSSSAPTKTGSSPSHSTLHPSSRQARSSTGSNPARSSSH